jgi:uncharacterized membrane protein
MPSARPVSTPPQVAARPVSTPPQVAARPVPTVRRSRPSRFLRGLQILLSILVMLVVPVVALVVAYGYGNGDSLDVDATNLVDDIRDLLGI